MSFLDECVVFSSQSDENPKKKRKKEGKKRGEKQKGKKKEKLFLSPGLQRHRGLVARHRGVELVKLEVCVSDRVVHLR